MRKINPKSDNNNYFKYSIIISLHYYDIPYHREKTSKLDPFANKYNFNDTNPDIFEKNNSHISLAILDDNNNQLINTSNNDSINKAYIIKINEDRYAAIKPSSNNLIKTKQLIKKMSHAELEQILTHIIKCFEYNHSRKVLMEMIKNNILLESE